MQWLAEHGAISTYTDYLALPQRVVEDARLVMAAEHQKREIEQRKAESKQRKGASHGKRSR